jgi:hypothetical protein
MAAIKIYEIMHGENYGQALQAVSLSSEPYVVHTCGQFLSVED